MVSQINSSLTKTCAGCGLSKPLSAFLQLSGSEGSSYGNICSSCRKTNLDQKKNSEPHESTSSTSGLRIDSKVKVKTDIDKKEQHQSIEELYYQDRDKAEERQVQKTLKTEKIEKDEKKHRKDFLSKSSFLDNMNKKPQQPQSQPLTVNSLSQETVEDLEKRIDFTAPFIDTQIAGKLKYGSEFLKVKAWLGGAAPIVQQAERALENKKKQESIEKTSQPTRRK